MHLNGLLDKANGQLCGDILNNPNVGRLANACRILAQWSRLFKKINDGHAIAFPLELLAEMNTTRLSTVRFLELIQVLQHILKEIPQEKNEKKRIALAIELRAKYRKADLGAGIKERLQQLSQGKLPQEEKEMDENAEEAKD